MKRPFQVSLFVLAGALGASGAETSPLLRVDRPVPPAPAAPAKPRGISPAVAEKLSAAAPKYVVPTAVKPAADTSVDRRDIDKPRNGIIRLPSYIVQEDRPPQINHRDILTPKGQLDLGFKRHPGLRIGNLWGLNNRWAYAMLEEEERLERIAEMNDLLSLLPNAEHAQMKPAVQQAFIRRE